MAFSISSLLGSFKIPGLGGESDTSVLGIDIGSTSLKLVQLRASRGVAVLETYGEIALGPYGNQPIGKAVRLTPEKTAEAIKDLIREANVTARTGGISIPFSASLITILDLPLADPESLKRIIPIEARKYIPIPVDQVSLDWFVLPKEPSEESAFAEIHQKTVMQAKGQEVLLVAIHNDVLQQYQTMTQTADLTVQFYEIEIFSAIRSSLGHGVSPVLVVDLGASTTKLYVVERGVVRLTHTVSLGGQQMSEIVGRALNWEFEKAERVKRERGMIASTAYSVDENDRIHTAMLSTLTRIFSEANRVLLTYGERYNKNVSKVVFTGGGASLPGLLDVARQSLHAEIEVANPFAHTEAPAFLESVLREIGPGFAVSIGLALRKLKHE